MEIPYCSTDPGHGPWGPGPGPFTTAGTLFKNSFYNTIGEKSSICAYECDALLERAEHNPDCLDPISLEVQRLGGVIPFFGLLGIFLLLSLLIFSMLSYRSQVILENMKELRESLYEVWENEDERGRGKVEENDLLLADNK